MSRCEMVNIYFCRVDERTFPILRELRNVRSKNIRLWFDKSSAANKVVGMIKDKLLVSHDAIDNELYCFRWDVGNECVCHLYDPDNGQRHLVSRKVMDGTDFICVDSEEHINNQLVFFQDAVHLEEFPREFVKFPCFCSSVELFKYLSSVNAFAFTLDDEGRFQKCNGLVVQGASVYRDKQTGYYWYLDMLHKTHYEVFDGTGKKHLGEADLNGKLDTNKADKGKRLDIR